MYSFIHAELMDVNKQLIRPMMAYAYPVLRHTANNPVGRLQALQSKRFRINATLPWCVRNLQLQENQDIRYLD